MRPLGLKTRRYLFVGIESRLVQKAPKRVGCAPKSHAMISARWALKSLNLPLHKDSLDVLGFARICEISKTHRDVLMVYQCGEATARQGAQ